MMDTNFTVKPTNLDQTIKNIVMSIDKGYELQNMDEDTITSDTKLDYNDSLILKPFYQRDYRSSIAMKYLPAEQRQKSFPIA